MKPVPLTIQFWFALRLAWRQMIFSRAKLLAAVLGVMFACVLVYIQTGFRDALYASVVLAPSKIDGDLFLIHKQTEAFWRTIPFARAELFRTMAHPDVREVIPLYMGLAPFKNPQDHTKRTLTIYGYDPQTHLMTMPEVIKQHNFLIDSDTGLFDEASRPEFGPIPQLLGSGPVLTEINDRGITLRGKFKLGGSFASDGNVIVSDSNFFRIFRGRGPEQVDLGVIRLKPGANPLQVQKSLNQRVTPDVYLFTFAEMKQHEFDYWQKNVPIGFIFGFGTIMGLVVGLIIVYQILFTDITAHLNQYATLTAMGYTFRQLLMVVIASSLILAVLGFIPGTMLSWALYQVAEANIFLPMPLPLSKMISIFTMILVMCILSGALAMQKLRSVDPADMF
jgi:putative ABC transport system permease protein